MTGKPVAIVLGGTIPHVHLIELLKERGFYTLLLDYTPNPPAKEFADEHLSVSTLDKDAVLDVARARSAQLIISTNVDQANVTCCYVSEKMGLYSPYSYETALDVTDKQRMKRIMWENNIPTSRYIQVISLKEIETHDLHFPLMVKPADSNSANGVKRVSTQEELEKNLPDALKYSRNGKAIVEEFVEGKEISAYGVVVNGTAKLLMHQERLSVYDGEDNVIKCYASLAPSRISDLAEHKAEQILTMIAKAFHLDNTPLFFQGIVNGDDISVIEFAPRVGGGISFQTIKDATGFDIISAALDSYLNITINIDNWHPFDGKYAVNQIYGTNGVYDKTVGGEKLLHEGVVKVLSFYKHKGDEIDSSRASSSRIGVMVVSDLTESGLRKRISDAFSRLDSYDVNGRSIIRRDLNLDLLWNSTFTNK
ncbi:MAG: ATP-grasp domain-containing protein [Prevotella sp.]|nr:ATP-grasp domain-containing protein [Prevotella sp.]